jgi:phenylpropionate dioxygenase-like ring-hydroxylating dioxygenase large terminal subunit
MSSGWQLLALAEEMSGDVTPLRCSGRPLMAVRPAAGVRIFDATCPHRGAHLGHGGVLRGGRVTCPFHGRRIELGDESGSVYSVAEHPALVAGPALFGNVGSGADRGFREVMAGLAETHQIVPALSTVVRAAATLVIENAFDRDHFVPVHNVRRALGMTVSKGDHGDLTVEGELETVGPPGWVDADDGPYRERFYARAFSPHLVLTEIGVPGAAPVVITGATPLDEGCAARVVFAIPRGPDGADRPEQHVAALVAGAQRAFRQDVAIWEHVDPAHTPMYEPRDAAVLAFQDFCAAAGS